MKKKEQTTPASIKTIPTWAMICMLCAALFLAYSNSFKGEMVFDDASSIRENESVRSLLTGFFPPGNSGLTVAGRPVLNFSVAINYAMGGENVVGYHIGNLLIHLCGALALFGLVRRTLLLPSMREKWGNYANWTALAIAALWGLHPLQTESVTYMIQRAESLVGLFYWLTLYCFVRAVSDRTPSDSPRYDKRWLIASVVACIFGMGSKEVMAGAPLMVLFLDRAFVSGSFRESWTRRKKYYIALAITWLVLALCIIWTGKRGSTVGANEFATWWRYAFTSAFAIAHYLKLVFWPNPLVLDYGKTIAMSYSDAAWQTPFICGLGVISLLLLWKRPKLGSVCVFFFMTLGPSSSFVPVVTQTLAQHRMYLAIASVVILVVIAVQRWFGVRVLVLFTAAVTMVFGVLTFKRNEEYRTEESIWKTVAERCPYNARGWCALMSIYVAKNDLPAAKLAGKSVAIYCPNDYDAMAQYVDVLVRAKETDEVHKGYKYILAHAPLSLPANKGYGSLLLEEDKPAEAIEYFKTALEVDPNDNGVRYNIGRALVASNKLEEALPYFRKLVEKEPHDFMARNNLGSTLLNLGRVAEAVPILEKGVELDPPINDLRRTLALAYITQGRLADAVAQLQTLLLMYPEDSKAYSYFALVRTQQGEIAEARDCYEKAIQFGTDEKTDILVALHASAGEAAMQTGDAAAAAKHYEDAIKLDPNLAQAHYELALIYVHMNRKQDAVNELKEAVRLQPDLREEIERNNSLKSLK